MGMLPYAFRSIAELTIWIGLALFILSRASGIDTETLIQLNIEKANNYLQMLMNSPDCFAYEERRIAQISEKESGLTRIKEQRITRTGVIDITKFYDVRHQNCLRRVELWDNVITVEERQNLCGWSFWSNFGLDPNDDCAQGYVCVSNICLKVNPNQDEEDLEKLSELKPATGKFLVYNITLYDEETREKHAIASYEHGAKLAYKPVINYPELAGEGWAGKIYPEYVSCYTDFGGRVVTAETPVMIAYPSEQGVEKHVGTLSIELCIGTYEPLE